MDEMGGCGTMEEVSLGWSAPYRSGANMKGGKARIPLLHPGSPIIHDSVDESMHVVCRVDTTSTGTEKPVVCENSV